MYQCALLRDHHKWICFFSYSFANPFCVCNYLWQLAFDKSYIFVITFSFFCFVLNHDASIGIFEQINTNCHVYFCFVLCSTFSYLLMNQTIVANYSYGYFRNITHHHSVTYYYPPTPRMFIQLRKLLSTHLYIMFRFVEQYRAAINILHFASGCVFKRPFFHVSIWNIYLYTQGSVSGDVAKNMISRCILFFYIIYSYLMITQFNMILNLH